MTKQESISLIDRSDHLWFKDAVIYQLHVKAFFDSNNDGIGDLQGLIQRLDYIKDMGVTAVWVLPFYPSPQKDDGYDISDYRNINSSYGTMHDFRRLVQECHRRGLRVITELVINHTSDQHPWFQRARRAKAGSLHRDFYVWSDTPERYKDTRIIFVDTETSNWAWDPVAQAYYWHRFYSHQPELNFDNPHVFEEVVKILRYWLSMGVDGLRLDAIPYLVEREGTSNESLPETHDVLKRIRAEIDAHFPDCMLLAEANQWPEDVRPYFGDGDECHMAFHFPLMPRMYMAIAQEDRHPITDIMRQTPEIPENCQWALFLRNHDELTLEMVTDRERDYLWKFYAVDPRMRLNFGIRRRLAPLLDDDRRKIELMTALLLSLPGTPIMYYGDEIGMGDNVYLGDRNGVRTPMQWSPDRNGGFSRADTAQLYLPPNMDPIFGYEVVNVEAQLRNTTSLLNWNRRLLAVRQGQNVFGRGALEFIYPGNRRILAFVRSHEGRVILCVFNLARSAQAVQLDLARFKGRIPVELMGRSAFPPIGDLPYLLTLPSYGFFWFVLAGPAELPNWHESIPDPQPEFVTLVTRNDWRDIMKTPALNLLERNALLEFITRQRWFSAKDKVIAATHVRQSFELGGSGANYMVATVDVAIAGGDEEQRYCVPLAMADDAEASAGGGTLVSFMVAQIRRGAKLQGLYDAVAVRDFPLALLRAMADGSEVEGQGGKLRFTPTDELRAIELPADVEVRRLGAEQSNSTVLVGDRIALKVYRRLVIGIHPEVELGYFLTRAGYENTPPVLGSVECIDADGTPTALAIAQAFVRNQGDGWTHALDNLNRALEQHEVPAGDALPASEAPGQDMYLTLIAELGRNVAGLHRTLAGASGNPAFEPEAIDDKDVAQWRAQALHEMRLAFAALQNGSRTASDETRAAVLALLKRRNECIELIKSLSSTVEATKTRIHGDLHLGQVLLAQRRWYVIDFEGEPARDLAYRRSKQSPLRDIAGMLRSFDYVAHSAVRSAATSMGSARQALVERALEWRDVAIDAFLAAYREAVGDMSSYPRREADAKRLTDLFMLEKACYEIRYEAASRPDWLGIPVAGALAILDSYKGHSK
jgi:maltose alpha-D-glucosyltransferase/alpha-amylase